MHKKLIFINNFYQCSLIIYSEVFIKSENGTLDQQNLKFALKLKLKLRVLLRII